MSSKSLKTNKEDERRQTDDRVHYTTFIRLPFPRGDFVDPPLVGVPLPGVRESSFDSA